MLEFFPGFLLCLDVGNLTLTLSWFPLIAASRRAFRAGEEAITFLKTDEYWGPICMRFCKAKSCKFFIVAVAVPRAFSSKRKETRMGKRQDTSWERWCSSATVTNASKTFMPSWKICISVLSSGFLLSISCSFSTIQDAKEYMYG